MYIDWTVCGCEAGKHFVLGLHSNNLGLVSTDFFSH